jgi:hypothetical protein
MFSCTNNNAICVHIMQFGFVVWQFTCCLYLLLDIKKGVSLAPVHMTGVNNTNLTRFAFLSILSSSSAIG